MKIITIVGCGQIGSRHLQAILKINEELLIQVVYRSDASLRFARERASEVPCDIKKIKIEWHNSFSGLQVADLCIIATTAVGRVGIISSLLKTGNKRFLIEKVVCQSDAEYLTLLNEFEDAHAKGWVNCCRRYYPFYRRLKRRLKDSKQIVLKITGGNHGLGCNAIHFLDLFGYLSGNQSIKINGNFLQDELLPNKRSDKLVEFCGTLVGEGERGSFFDITFSRLPIGNCSVVIMGDNLHCFIDEIVEKAMIACASENWSWQDYEFNHLKVSQLTTMIADDVFKTDDCLLATLAESYEYHKCLFNVFNKHIKKVTGSNPNVCPIS